MPHIRLLGALFSCVLIAGCTDDDATHAPIASPAASAVSTATAEAAADLDGVPIRWEAVQPDLFVPVTGQEQDTFSQNVRRRFAEVPDERFIWQVFAASLDSEPQLLHTTRRALGRTTWSRDGKQLAVHLQGALGTLVLSTDNTARPKHLSRVARPVHLSPDGSKAAVVVDSSGLVGQLAVVDLATGSATVLRGLPASVSQANAATWSPDGAFLLLLAGTQGVPPQASTTGEWYVVPTTNGDARAIAPGSARFADRGLHAAWSSTVPHRLAYVGDSGALWLFDPTNGVAHWITPDGTFKRAPLEWEQNEERIRVGAQFVDVRTGDLGNYPLPPEGYTAFAVSPDGRYVVTGDLLSGDRTFNVGGCGSAQPQQNRVLLFERATGAMRVLKDCDGRFFVSFQWLNDSSRLLMRGGNCYQCESASSRISLIDVATTEEVPLTGGLEFMASAVVSPDGQKILVTGDRLRVYSAEGVLLTQIEPPAGFSVTAASWSADSQQFAYVLGPTGVWSI